MRQVEFFFWGVVTFHLTGFQSYVFHIIKLIEMFICTNYS